MADFPDTSTLPESQRDYSLATEEQWAAIDFVPWVHSDDEWKPPTNEEWAKLANPHLVTIRIAWITMYKSKSELMDVVRDLDEEAGVELMNQFRYTLDFLKGMLTLLEGAEARIISAGTAYNIGQTNVEKVM